MPPESPPEPEIDDLSAEFDRTDVLDNLEEVMEESVRKAIKGRIRDPETERVRIKWARAFVNAATEFRQLAADLEESEHEARIERLEQLLDEELNEGE